MTTVGIAAIASRAHGLATHLLPRATLERALTTTDLDVLARLLRDSGMPATAHAATCEALELAVRRWAAVGLERLARWLPERPELTDVLFGEEDRRSVRAMVRGAAAGAAPELRMAGLIPTPRLAERPLQELARQTRVPAIAALLTRWNHPLGPPLLAVAPAAEPDLVAAERKLGIAHVDMLRSAARRAPRPLRSWIAETIDLENARTAMQLSPRLTDAELAKALHSGGRIPTDRIARAVRAEPPASPAEALAARFEDALLAEALRRCDSDPARLDDALLAARISSLRARVRADPIQPAAVLLFALRLRAQVIVIRQAAWRLALGRAPGSASLLLEVA